MTQNDYGSRSDPVAPAHTSVAATILAPFDRVRWGPILAGIFAAMSVLTLLSVLGLAIGLTAWDPGDDTRNYSVGAGIWSILSALIAFFIGGWLAARSAAAVGERNGLLNGAMVWAVTIPLLIFLLGGGMAALADHAISGGGGFGGSRTVYFERTSDYTDRAQTASGRIGDSISPADSTNMGQEMPVTREEARSAARGAWWTLGSLVLGLAAASLGGWSGARDVYYRDDTTTPPDTAIT